MSSSLPAQSFSARFFSSTSRPSSQGIVWSAGCTRSLPPGAAAFTPAVRSRPNPDRMPSVTESQVCPPGNQGQPPSPFRSDWSRLSAACASLSVRVVSNKSAMRARASFSSTASRTHGVSASSVFTRSVFFSSGLSRAPAFPAAAAPFHCSKTLPIRGSLVARCRARLLA